MKIYAKQVPPEYQDSNFDIANYENIILKGNRHFQEYWPDWAENLSERMTEAINALYYIQSGRGYYDNWEEVLHDLLPPQGRKEYTRVERKKWMNILERYDERGSAEENACLCSALSLITGRVWDWCDLKGTCQGDWIECVYMEDMWDREALEVLEAEYFNTGTEWHITEGENDTGYYQYCTGWNDNMIRNEIAETTGAETADIILLKFTGWTRSASYEEVTA